MLRLQLLLPVPCKTADENGHLTEIDLIQRRCKGKRDIEKHQDYRYRGKHGDLNHHPCFCDTCLQIVFAAVLELIFLSPFLFRANPYFRKESLRYDCITAEKKETGYRKDTRDSYTYSSFCSILLSSRLYCRFWNCTKSTANRGSRTLPPVRNHTSPRRK